MKNGIRISPTKTHERCTGRIGSVAGGATPPSQFDDRTLRIAVTEWLDDPDNAKTKYGHISNWDTTNVTNMNRLFMHRSGEQFNEPLKDCMFAFARAFNQPLHKCDTSQVTDMSFMFFRQTNLCSPNEDFGRSKNIRARHFVSTFHHF